MFVKCLEGKIGKIQYFLEKIPYLIDKNKEERYNKDMEKFIHEKIFDLRYRDVDFQDELKPSAAFSFMEEIASYSADQIGWGVSFLKPRNYAFILSGVVCEFTHPILHGESVTVRTWPLPPAYAVFGREYQILQGGKVLANASSRWCLMDFSAGKLLTAKALAETDADRYETARTLENVRWKIPAFPVEDGELRFVVTVANTDYDHNLHVNNTRYVDYFFNCFSLKELSLRRVKRISVSYQRQCYERDTLSFYRKQTENNVFLLQGVNQKGETVTTGEVIFVEEKN